MKEKINQVAKVREKVIRVESEKNKNYSNHYDVVDLSAFSVAEFEIVAEFEMLPMLEFIILKSDLKRKNKNSEKFPGLGHSAPASGIFTTESGVL